MIDPTGQNEDAELVEEPDEPTEYTSEQPDSDGEDVAQDDEVDR